MERRERGFFGKLLVFILALLAFIGLIAMALSVVNPYIDPKHYIWTSFFGLAFWEIFAFNLLIFFALLLLWSRKIWISIIALLIAIPGVRKSYSFGSRVDEDNFIRVMSYNVHNFNHIDGQTEKEDFGYQVINKVREQNPDVLCCQEFDAYEKGVSRVKGIENFSQSAGFQYIYYNKKRNYGGNVIFSKYPLEQIPEDTELGKGITSGIMVLVDAGSKGRFYVANMHLVSYQITDGEIDVLTNSQELRNQFDTIGMSVARKLKYAFERRSEEVSMLLETMPQFDGPIVVCGDFNDTPMSFTYKQMQKSGFVDSFTKVGHGIKPTYAGKLPLMRIDYIWGNNQVKPLNFKRIRYKASDHYPVMLDFSVQTHRFEAKGQNN